MELNMSRTLLIVLSVSSLFLNFHASAAKPPQLNSAIQKICGATENPEVCASSILPSPNGRVNPASVLVDQIRAGIRATQQAIEKAKQATKQSSATPYAAEQLKVCLESYDSAMDSWKSALDSIKAQKGFDLANHLTSVTAMIMSCEDAFTNDDPSVPTKSPLAEIDQLILKMSSNGLNIRRLAFPNA
ncbi:hypothetical protein U1Q18_034511 [Sarracenia purpurea var. burkii]